MKLDKFDRICLNVDCYTMAGGPVGRQVLLAVDRNTNKNIAINFKKLVMKVVGKPTGTGSSISEKQAIDSIVMLLNRDLLFSDGGKIGLTRKLHIQRWMDRIT